MAIGTIQRQLRMDKKDQMMNRFKKFELIVALEHHSLMPVAPHPDTAPRNTNMHIGIMINAIVPIAVIVNLALSRPSSYPLTINAFRFLAVASVALLRHHCLNLSPILITI